MNAPLPATTIPRVCRALFRWVASLTLGLGFASLAAQEPKTSSSNAESLKSKPKLEKYYVIPESYQWRPPVFVLLPGAKDVGFTLVRETSDGLDTGLEVVPLTEYRDLRVEWTQCYRQGQIAAAKLLKSLEPTIVRNDKKVIEYAHFQSDNPLTCSIFIAPEFRQLLENQLGKELYVVAPDRYNVFAFPKLSSSVDKAARKMGVLHKEALYPVSREVFEVSREGIRVAGKF